MTERICPHCKRPVYDDDALLCLYCGGSLACRRFFSPAKLIFAAVVALMLISFLLTMLR
ncbi:MAG: hypothetical protein ACM3OC_03470 [Deltaproteobacteria bacterium]